MLLDEAAVIPRVAEFAALGDGVLEELEGVFKGAAIALRGDALEGLDDEVFAGSAAGALRACLNAGGDE